MSNEFELRLALAPKQMAAARRLPLFAAHGKGRWRHEDMVSDYFDTEDLALWRAGYSLRLRTSNGRTRQTLKSETTDTPLWAERGEWEIDVPGPGLTINESAMQDWGIPSEAADVIERERLLRCFSASFRRSRRLVTLAATTFEVAIDKGVLRARNGNEAPIASLEVELKDGSRSGLVRVAGRIADGLGTGLQSMAKSTLGFALLTGRFSPHAAGSPLLEDCHSPLAAYARIALSCLAHFESNEACAYEGADPEGVHQARVALRRWRSAASLFRDVLDEQDRLLVQEIKWLASVLGPARDWDVFLGEVLAPMREAFPGDEALARLMRAAEAQRAAAYDTARQSLRSRRATEVRLAAAERLFAILEASEDGDADTLRDFADAALHRRRRKVRHLGRELGRLDVPQLHELRILAKKARYASDFLGPLYERKLVRRHGRALAALQTALGGLNDAAVGLKLLQEIRSRETRRKGAHVWLDRAEASVRAWLAAISHDRLARLASAWTAYDGLKPYWNKPAAKRNLEAA